MSDIRRGFMALTTSTRMRRSSRSKILAASFAFMFSYMVTRLLNFAASASSFFAAAPVRRASISLSSCSRCSMRRSAAFSRLSRTSISRCARFQLLAALLQAFEHGALARRHRGFRHVGRCRPRPRGRSAASFGGSGFGGAATEPVMSSDGACFGV